MEFSIKFDSVKSGWSIVYIEGLQDTILKKILYFFLWRFDFVLANSADSDEMLHYVAFHLGLHCLPKYLFRGFWFQRLNRWDNIEEQGIYENIFLILGEQGNRPINSRGSRKQVLLLQTNLHIWWPSVIWYFMHVFLTVLNATLYGPRSEKTVFGGLRTTQAQTSLRICAVWSVPLLFAF